MRSLLPLILSIGLGCAKKPEPLKIENSETEIDATKTEDVTTEDVTTEVESQQANEVVTDESIVVEKDVDPDLTQEPESKSDEQVEAEPTTESSPEDNKIIINELVSNAVALLTTDDKANAAQALRSLTDIDNQYPGHAEVAYNMGLAH